MSSCSSSNTHWIHDVFLNFRGEDTRKSFVSHLYAALSNAGINTFIDDKIPKGTKLGAELVRAIQGSRISIVVFSANYTSSRWCLDELVKIMECHRTYGQVVMPIFYDIEPSVVRHQRGAFGEGLEALAQKCLMEGTHHVLKSWKSALEEAGNFTGWDARAFSGSALVEGIVDFIFGRLDMDLLSITEFPVGLESRVQQVVEFINGHSGRGCFVGIWGMGGLGKTTMAKVIYNQFRQRFKRRSFLENIREVCEKDSRGCIDLQQQLLSDLLKTKNKIHSIVMGIAMIENSLCEKRSLVILDDVTEFEQLKALCGNCKWIGRGSVIIITTRDVRLLNVLKVNHIVHICRIKEMDENESLELFSWHAFRKKSPRGDLIKLSMDIVDYCGGLPLALEVLGSYLFERTKEEWESVLSKLKEIPNDRVQEKLRISYDSLDTKEKNIFLDICFFFIGKDRAVVTEILKGCDLYPEIGITILVERSLIKLEKNNKLKMHDLLRDMGREIIRQSSPEEPEKRSRLWIHQEVLDVLSEHTGTKAIEGLALKLQRTSGLHFNTKAFEKMKKLRLLQLDHVQLVGDYEYLNKNLRWLCWQGFPLKHIPDKLYQKNVISIELKYSNIRLVWKEPQLLPRLKILNLSHSRNLMRTPDFSKLPNLAKLILEDCPSLSEVHQSIGDLTNLLMINLKDCTSLSNLPRRIYQLKSLETLILSGCSKIDKLEEDIMQMESLTTLIAKDTAVKEMPHSIIRLKRIGYISLCGHEGLARDVFPSLVWSWMSPTAYLGSSTQPCGSMSTSLMSMDIQHNNLGDLLPMLGGLSKLRSILLQYDSKFKLTQNLKRIMDGLCDVKFTESERASYASQISENAMESYLIGMGSYDQVINMFSKNISEGLRTNDSSDFSLPGDNYPCWLAYIGKGHSVHFQLPEKCDGYMKGIILCVVYSSTSENMAAECLTGVWIVNYTKCTIQIYQKDTIISFNDEDWQGLVSNLRPSDDVEIFVAYGHGPTVMKIAVYLLY
ncbi:TMV resistance protein N, partial [Mucuna pruriens]